MYPVDAHVKAIKYLNSYTFDNKNKKLYLDNKNNEEV